MTDTPVVVVDATTRQFESWKGVAVIAETLGSSGWALAGGQMVALHLLMADLPFPRVTIDADTIVDVRARSDAARLASTGLVGAGWVGSGVDNVVHRFTSSTGGVIAPMNLLPKLVKPGSLKSRPSASKARRVGLRTSTHGWRTRQIGPSSSDCWPKWRVNRRSSGQAHTSSPER